MSIGFIFWLIILLWFVFGIAGNWPASNEPRAWFPLGGNFLLFVLLVLLGIGIFGWPIKA